MAFNVRVLHISGCDIAARTAALVAAVNDDFGLTADLQVIEVRDQEQAETLHFQGSPTVQINGLDIDPAVRNSSAFGFF